MLLQSRGTLEGVDVYGFSTLEGDGQTDFGHYFDKLGDMGRRHHPEHEGAFLRQLLAEAGDGPARPAPSDERGEVTVFNCAYREYNPARGKTGGPGGVLATQQKALGSEYRGQALRYVFDTGDKQELRREHAVQIAGLGGKPSDIVLGAEYLRSHPEVLRAQAEGRQLLFVCHELGSAYGAYLLGAPYVIVYHQQGGTLQEMRSAGRPPSRHEAAVVNRLEQVICSNAQKMFFPSLGARDTFKATSESGATAPIDFADWALYNTVSAVDHEAEPGGREALAASVRRELGLPAKDADTDVFLSVGDYNRDKGLDNVPALLQRYAETSGRKVVWVAVGSTSDIALYDGLQRQKREWSFTACLVGERMKHDRLMTLLDYADYYVMLHRNSIFDLATLEAMKAGKALILSPVGGNPEVNLDDNVVFVTAETVDEACAQIVARDRAEWGESNRRVFAEHFSLERFTERYRAMLDEQLDALLAGGAS